MSDEVNIPLLRKAVEWAEAEAQKPKGMSQWLQGWWRTDPGTSEFVSSYYRNVHNVPKECGTTYCIAGYVCELIGAEIKDVADYPREAAKALGIEWDPWDDGSGHLFTADNTIEDVRRIAEKLAGEKL